MFLRSLAGTQCADDEYKCRQGPCIHRSMVCNKEVDCDLTWDDEDTNCRKPTGYVINIITIVVVARPISIVGFSRLFSFRVFDHSAQLSMPKRVHQLHRPRSPPVSVRRGKRDHVLVSSRLCNLTRRREIERSLCSICTVIWAATIFPTTFTPRRSNV